MTCGSNTVGIAAAGQGRVHEWLVKYGDTSPTGQVMVCGWQGG